MWVSSSQRVVYLAMPRTASRSIAFWIRRDYTALRVNGHHGCIADPAIRNWFAFTSVRNPYARVVSAYKNTIKHENYTHPEWPRKEGFAEFAEKCVNLAQRNARTGILQTQCFYLDTWQQCFDHPIRLVRFENLLSDLQALPFVNKPIELDEVGRNDHIPWQEFYSQSIADKVFSIYQEDFERFGYTKVELPRFDPQEYLA